MIRSFRARLTFWNVVVIAIVLIGFSTGIVYVNRARLSADIDRELADRAINAPPQLGFRGGMGRGQGGPGGLNGQGGQPDGPGGPRAQGDPGGPPSEGGGPGVPPRFNDPVAMRFADLRRPRRFDEEGRPLGPMQDPAFDARALAMAMEGRAGYSNGEFGGEPIRIFTMPVRRGPLEGTIIQVARDTKELDRIWASQMGTLLWFLPGALIAAAFGAFFLTGRAVKPIGKMKEAANKISEQDLSQRLDIEGEDEFAELGQTFNSMIGRLDDSFTRLKSAFSELEEAHETQKRFTADASHELRTPLTRIRLATSAALQEGATPEEQRKALAVADTASKAMSRLVQEMLVLAKADAGQLNLQREKIDLRVLASDVVESFPSVAPRLDTDFQDAPVVVTGDTDHLTRVISNLLDNALRHTPPDGKIQVSVVSSGSRAILRVRDTGEGIAAQHLPHLTERFYRADTARSRNDGGSGLGLAICKTIVEAHSGCMRIESEVGSGTTVTVELPAA